MLFLPIKTAKKDLPQPTKSTAVQQYNFTQVSVCRIEFVHRLYNYTFLYYVQNDGVRFLDNCIFDHWGDVDSLMELSTTNLPPEVTDQVNILK